MSASKARLTMLADDLAARLDRQEQDIVFLLQALLDIGQDHPEIELPDLGKDRFPERIWRQITC